MMNRYVLLAAAWTVIAVAGRAAATKPNVVLIMADDVSWEAFGCYGAEDYKTPNIDRLAAEGVRFSHCYSTPLCTPSRVMIMTGKQNFRNYTHFGYLGPEEKTFGHLMQQAGYKTMIAGKWQLNGLYDKLSGHDDSTRVYKAGFDEFALWQVTKGKGVKQGGGERFWSPPLEINGTLTTIEENRDKYGPDIMSDHVCDFIGRHKDRPFFIYYPTVLVHDPFVPTPDTIGSRARGHEANREPDDKAEKKANFVAMVEYLDKVVGKIIRKLEAVGRLEDTLIIFTADNGTHKKITSRWNGMEIPGGKGALKDTGTHVPLVVYWKGRTPAGTVIDDLIDFTDSYPTIAEAAGIRPAEDDPVDGRSFVPQLKGEPGRPRDWLLCHYQPYWGPKPGLSARTQDYKLYWNGRFYHVPEDILEEHDLGVTLADERVMTVHRQLQQALERVPPVNGIDAGEGGRNLKLRPTYPDWEKLSGFD
jgi:arylsulfatase A-like enzyme